MSRNTKQPIQFYRGTTAQHSGYTGPAGECTVDTTKNTLVVHDGVKAGGYPLVKEDHTVTGDGYVLANGSRSTTIGSRTLALSLDTAALRNLLADPSGTDAVAGNLKLSDAVDSSLDAATGGTAATPKAVKAAYDLAASKASDDLVVHIHNNETIEDVKTFLQGPYGTSADLTTSEIDLSKGVVFSKTVSADTVFTFINAPSGRAATFNLIITNGGSATITWPASVKWTDAAAPTLTASGVDVLTFMTPNGTTWYGTLAIVNAG